MQKLLVFNTCIVSQLKLVKDLPDGLANLEEFKKMISRYSGALDSLMEDPKMLSVSLVLLSS